MPRALTRDHFIETIIGSLYRNQSRRPIKETNQGDQSRRPIKETNRGDQSRRPIEETNRGDQ